MPTECERNSTSLAAAQTATAATTATQQQLELEAYQRTFDMSETLDSATAAAPDQHNSHMMSKSQASSIDSPTTDKTPNGLKGSTNGGDSRKSSLISPDPTSYVTKARVTRPIPPPPSYNPMQFVQIKPCNLYQTAQEQLKKAEEVKKIKEIKKEEPEDWQNNLDNWKSSRRKRVEHIIDRVVEVKKLELEEHDRSRRKSKTFSEMIEERGDRAGGPRRTKLASLAVYNEDESNDLSDLGIGTSSASGKSSLSEDYDNNSVTSDNAELDKAIQGEHNHKSNIQTLREYISSPGYETSSSTAPASSPDPCEYTYEGAIQDYKQRISRAASGGYKIGSSNSNNNINNHSSNNNHSNMNGNGNAKQQPPTTLNLQQTTNPEQEQYSARRGHKIEDRLLSFEITSPSAQSEGPDGAEKSKVDVPKIDLAKRKEIFESQKQNGNGNMPTAAERDVPRVNLRDRFKFEANASTDEPQKKDVKRLSGDLTSIRQRLQSLEQQKEQKETTRTVDIPVPSLKDRLSCLQNAAKKEEIKKPPVALVDARQLEIMRKEEETAKQRLKQDKKEPVLSTPVVKVETPEAEENDCTLTASELDDSGVHTTYDSDAVGEQIRRMREQEAQLNAAIAALAMEEKQLEQAANAVNQIEAEFDEITNTATATVSGNSTNQTQLPYEMDFSINEALELALEAIDKEQNQTANNANNNSNNDDKQIKIETTNQTTEEVEKENERNNKHKVKDDDAVASTKTAKEAAVAGEKQEQAQDAPKYVPQEVDAAAAAAAEAEIMLEPIYENVAATATATTTATSSESAIIPNKNSHERKSCIDNNNDNNKQQQQKQQQQNQNNQNQSHQQHNHHQQHQHQQQRHHQHNKSQINNSNNQTNQNNCENIENNKNLNNNAFAKNNLSATATTLLLTTTTTIAATATANVKKASELLIADQKHHHQDVEPYYQVPKSSEPYYDAPKHLRPVPVYENIEVFYNGLENTITTTTGNAALNGFTVLEPPKEKPPPPPAESPPPMHDGGDITDTWSSSENTYETISSRHQLTPLKSNALHGEHPSPPIKRVNSTKRIKKELRNKRSSFLGIDPSALDDEEMTVAPPPDMAQFLQQERQLEKQLYMKTTGLCDSSDTGESRDSGVSENHSRQSSEHYTNSSEENERHIDVTDANECVDDVSLYRDETSSSTATLLSTSAAQTPLLQTVKGDSAESWTESATAAAAASQSLTEATATANAKINSIEEKIREQEEVLRVERELLQLEQEELKRQRENLMLRENMARRELQHGAKMLMSANRRSLQELNGGAMTTIPTPLAALSQLPLQQQQQATAQQQIYANIPNLQQQYYQMDIDYRKSMSDLNEFSAAAKRNSLPPVPPTKPMRAMHLSATTQNSPSNGHGHHHHFHPQHHLPNQQEYLVMTANQRFGGSLVKIAAPAPTAAPRSQVYSNFQHRSQQNLSTPTTPSAHPQHGNMTRNTLHALSATPKPKYTDGWVQQQQQQFQNRKSIDALQHFANDPAWLSAYHQKRKSMPAEATTAFNGSNGGLHLNNNHWLVQEAEQRRLADEQRRSLSTGNTPLHQQKAVGGGSGGKPLPDAIIQTLTERVQSKGIGERKRLDNYNKPSTDRSPLHAASAYHHSQQQQQQQLTRDAYTQSTATQNPQSAAVSTNTNANNQDKVLSVSGKKKCSHCGDELGRGAAMIIESLLLFYHINCFKCCVCHVQLGDGLNGTDVRVRNHKLHCQNCYSSDDGVKFSCV